MTSCSILALHRQQLQTFWSPAWMTWSKSRPVEVTANLTYKCFIPTFNTNVLRQTPDLSYLVCSGPSYLFSIRTVLPTDCGQQSSMTFIYTIHFGRWEHAYILSVLHWKPIHNPFHCNSWHDPVQAVTSFNPSSLTQSTQSACASTQQPENDSTPSAQDLQWLPSQHRVNVLSMG